MWCTKWYENLCQFLHKWQNQSEMNKVQPVVRTGRPITRNRTQVLETALNAYWRNDRAAVSVNAVCVLAGISKPSLYREFGSEDGLTAAVLERYRQTVLVRLEALLLGRRGIQGDLLSRIRKDLICRSFLCGVSSSIFFR
jgi:AcrR family transcriptional regulator